MPTVIIPSGQLPVGLRAWDQYQVYNCLDAAVTAQLVPPMIAEMNPNHLKTYRREMRIQALCLHMSEVGLPIDHMEMLELVRELDAAEAKAERLLRRWCEAIFHSPVNPRSPAQVQELLYDYLKIPPVWKYDPKTRQRRRSTARDDLEKLRDTRPISAPFINAILSARENRKLSSVFKKGLEPGHPPRLRSHFKVGPETGRLASSENPYGRGTTVQNWTDRIRKVVRPTKGRCLLHLDLKTGESFGVAYLSGDQGYIEACTSGDVHTAACRLNWRELAWTGDLKQDKAIAESSCYRMFSYRDIMKKGGHATNYYGQPPTISKVALYGLVPVEVVAEFQRSYFRTFPGIKDWQLRTIEEIQRTGILVSPIGRERRFWGRPDDPATHREAIAHLPQSLIADVTNDGLIQVQEWIIRERLDIILIAQGHDSGTFELRIEDLSWAAEEIRRRAQVPVDFGPLGEMRIPIDLSVGLNWGKSKFNKEQGVWKNPLGLRDWAPGTPLHFA